MTAPVTCAEEMRQLADWLDEADRIIDMAFDAWGPSQGLSRSHKGDDVQRDLRAWAEYLEQNPTVDQEMWRRSNP